MEYQHEDGIATLTIRGSGAFNPDSLAAFNRVLDEVLANDNNEMLLLTGEGKNFSQGLDLEYLMGVTDPDAAMAFVKSCMTMIGRLLCFPLPVVSVLNGHAFGLGAMITLASDYKVMREDRGFFCLPEADLGMTLTKRMNALVTGKMHGAVLRDVLLTGRRMDAPSALSARIVDAIGPQDELRALAIALAAPMRGKNRVALAGLKRGVNAGVLQVIEADDAEVTIVA